MFDVFFLEQAGQMAKLVCLPDDALPAKEVTVRVHRSGLNYKDALAVAGFLPEAAAQALHGAHATLLDVGLACTLDRRPRLAPTTPAIEEACAAISAACVAAELPFG